MDERVLETRFARMGARLKVEEGRTAGVGRGGSLVIDVQRDGKGEFFDIRTRPGADVEFEVVDLQPDERHLLLMVREGLAKQKFLCGHDERHWFVAAVPERAGASTVHTAMEALKPVEVRQAQARSRVKTGDRLRRKNEAYVRQGEWFFVPEPDLQIEERLVLRSEPLTRGNGSKPHVAELCYHSGGEVVYVCDRYPAGLSEPRYRTLLKTRSESRSFDWRIMRRNPRVYVKGRISHSDHKTIVLRVWHRVLMNTENESQAMRNVAFLD